jgi:hypothetical protein
MQGEFVRIRLPHLIAPRFVDNDRKVRFVEFQKHCPQHSGERDSSYESLVKVTREVLTFTSAGSRPP